jgi:hypothetical protein
MGNCLLNGCKFAKDEMIEKSGTMMKEVHNGKGWRYQGK